MILTKQYLTVYGLILLGILEYAEIRLIFGVIKVNFWLRYSVSVMPCTVNKGFFNKKQFNSGLPLGPFLKLIKLKGP